MQETVLTTITSILHVICVLYMYTAVYEFKSVCEVLEYVCVGEVEYAGGGASV